MKKVWLAVGLSAALGLGAMAAAALGFHGFPGEGPGERDGRIGLMSSLPLYRAPESSVAEALAAQTKDAELAAHFAPVAQALAGGEAAIVAELAEVQGKAVDLGSGIVVIELPAHRPSRPIE